MLTAEEIKNVIEKAEKQIQELQALLSTVEAEPGRAEYGERYWHISDAGMIRFTIDERCDSDNYRYECGNHYPTEEDAIRAEKQIRLFRLLDRFSRQNGWTDEVWEDDKTDKWYIYYNYNIDTAIAMSVITYRDICQACFISESIAKQAIEKYHDLIMEVMAIDKIGFTIPGRYTSYKMVEDEGKWAWNNLDIDDEATKMVGREGE